MYSGPARRFKRLVEIIQSQMTTLRSQVSDTSLRPVLHSSSGSSSTSGDAISMRPTATSLSEDDGDEVFTTEGKSSSREELVVEGKKRACSDVTNYRTPNNND